MDFDRIIDRTNTHSMKWDMMQSLYGVSPDGGLSMWVADMDFRAAPPILEELRRIQEHGVLGYYGDEASYKAAICWWMENRHGWAVDPAWIFTTHGLVNGTALCIDTWTQPGEGIVLLTPVYHAFARVIHAAGRRVVECELVNNGGRYELDFDAWDAQMRGDEKMLLLSSPHNPGGRVWTPEELAGIVAFCARHGLLLVSDEIHHDLILPGAQHTPMALVEGAEERLVMMTATTKTFNIAAAMTGNVIIPDETLRAQFARRLAALAIHSNGFGPRLAEAAYSPAGAAWVDALCAYLDGNRALFDDAVNAIPGLASMRLESTYLAWVDFAGTGMERDEVIRRVQEVARIAPNHGAPFGKGGESFLRFNIAMPRALVRQAVERLTDAFADLQ